MKIIGIETSCDETGAAVITDSHRNRQQGLKILSNVVASSADLHAKTGGIIPENAAREQIKAILPVINEAIFTASQESDIDTTNWAKGNIDAIAVTVGPGLIGSLLVGVETAKTLSYLWNKPIIPVNHLIGHLYACWLETEAVPEFPAVGMVVSGGHTDIVLIKNHGQLKYLGGTRDDAAGEAFDKIARLLDIPYPGGPKLAQIADEFKKNHPKIKLNMFPRPMLESPDFDMSFSGLKTAVFNKLSPDSDKARFAAETQAAIVEILTTKLSAVVKKYRPESILIAGGVAANNDLRDTLAQVLENPRLRSLHIPPIELCTDNASYIASAGYYNYRTKKWRNVISHPALSITQEA